MRQDSITFDDVEELIEIHISTSEIIEGLKVILNQGISDPHELKQILDDIAILEERRDLFFELIFFNQWRKVLEERMCRVVAKAMEGQNDDEPPKLIWDN